ncbi:putative ABC transporter ATP-binding protein [Candidatus Nitrosomarinus catalina]|jgi:phosphonate transport system ATP-binding protein|uniref:Putative ABC transporter ATP-binding protein n=2 Tax=Candidatus Nitrosomarinus catalinensis TaxID=1898749 RepID=A0A2Z2HK93_9ARCH|nr:putative ABC transporter ATP-binding protein [Candidatus Nitrosomarinus catalina]
MIRANKNWQIRIDINSMAKTPPFSLISTKKIIQMNDVWTSYDSQSYALEGVNLSIDRGTNYAIVGQSGSGKSTLLKLMNGMMTPSKGAIKIDYLTPNMNNKKFKKMMHTIGYIPQSLGLVKNVSVLDNILIGALPRLNRIQSILKQFPEHEIQEAKRILKLVGLSGKESRKAYMLSGGEKRRVAIARALMQKPTILLADEIVSELDHVTSREIMNLVLDAQKKMNLTAIMVHHDMKLALEFANRVAVIKEGQKILEIGVEGDTIVDFQTGDMSIEEIMEMYNTDSKE